MVGRPKETGRYATREELCANVWDDYRSSPAGDRRRSRRIAALNGCSINTVNKILNTLEGASRVEPLVEGFPRKGGINPPDSQIFVRPPPPAPMKPKDDFAQRFLTRKATLSGVPLEVDPIEEFVVQEMDTDDGTEIGWWTRMTYTTEPEAQAYMDGLTQTGYPHRLRLAKITYEAVRDYAPESRSQ